LSRRFREWRGACYNRKGFACNNGEHPLEAEFDDGNSIVGETSIVEYKKTMHSKIKRVGLIPEKPKAYDQAVAAIEEAELIVLGPGSLYTSVIPNVLVAGISDAIKTVRRLRFMYAML
jgi:uncharacterized cofD-like protein